MIKQTKSKSENELEEDEKAYRSEERSKEVEEEEDDEDKQTSEKFRSSFLQIQGQLREKKQSFLDDESEKKLEDCASAAGR